MRNCTYGLLVVLFSGLMLGGCAKKEAVKAEEPVVPSIVTSPETAPPSPRPEPPKPTSPPASLKAEVVPEQTVVPAQPQKTVLAEVAEKAALETIHFDFDKSDLREPDREILTKNADILMNKIQGDAQIEGHCDERGSAEYNLALGERRARSAMKYLITLGVPEERLSIISYGKEMPVDPGHDENAWAKNRRAQFVIMGK